MKSTKSDPEAYVPLTAAEFQILLALAAGEQHGYAIMQQINEHTSSKMRIGPATLYRSIKRLLDNGLIEEMQERPDPTIHDERRRYYGITDLGLAVARMETKRLEETLQAARAVLPAAGSARAWAQIFHREEANSVDSGLQDP